jgi:hypothetical protein
MTSVMHQCSWISLVTKLDMICHVPFKIVFAQFEFLMGDNADNRVTFGVHLSLLYQWPGLVGELTDMDFPMCVPFRHMDGT